MEHKLLFSTKITDNIFQHFISTYDIILFTDCLLQNNCKKHIEDFNYHFFLGQRSKRVQGGETV